MCKQLKTGYSWCPHVYSDSDIEPCAVAIQASQVVRDQHREGNMFCKKIKWQWREERVQGQCDWCWDRVVEPAWKRRKREKLMGKEGSDEAGEEVEDDEGEDEEEIFESVEVEMEVEMEVEAEADDEDEHGVDGDGENGLEVEDGENGHEVGNDENRYEVEDEMEGVERGL
ncbi:hypothetical protein K458DRAFT_394100 [Lentithecium fluviatile CBS 122367]|uniref:Uncharacterized protein n=1 Tax=Lentithecium fluviatile CBS 122367 TaxID=1168545 RepID=A0A6G1ILU5_9PLEO|nr:hypothetical protein K458DRAFT_394100 [Lentithecium fluviatile CBS 122367]